MGFTDVGLYKISESVRAHAYLILSSQASARSGIVGNTASALTAQSVFLRRVLKRLQTPLPHKTGFNAADNPYAESEFLKICEDYRVPNDPIRYRDEKFY